MYRYCILRICMNDIGFMCHGGPSTLIYILSFLFICFVKVFFSPVLNIYEQRYLMFSNAFFILRWHNVINSATQCVPQYMHTVRIFWNVVHNVFVSPGPVCTFPEWFHCFLSASMGKFSKKIRLLLINVIARCVCNAFNFFFFFFN